MSQVKYWWVMLHRNARNASCQECVMSHMNLSCHIWMSHVTYECVTSHINQSCYIWMRHGTHEWVMSHWSNIAFQVITWNSDLVSLLEGLGCSNPFRFQLSGFGGFAGIDPTTSGLTVLRSDRLSKFTSSRMTWMSHVIHEWVMPHANESCQI